MCLSSHSERHCVKHKNSRFNQLVYVQFPPVWMIRMGKTCTFGSEWRIIGNQIYGEKYLLFKGDYSHTECLYRSCNVPVSLAHT